MKRKTTIKSLFFLVAMLVGGANVAWGEDWTTVWTTDFASAPSGMTYSVTNGSTSLDNGYLHYDQGGGSGNRAINTAFTADAFNVDTNWKMEFDWNCSASNQNGSSVTFATNAGNAFTITWAKQASTASITDANSTSLTTTLPTMGTTRGSANSWAHFTITGDTENGVYLTVTKGETTYVNNAKISSSFGYPKTFNGSLGRAWSWMYIDNIVFATPTIAGFVATPTGTITKAVGTSRKFTLSCLTDGATIYYSESDLEIGDAGWNTYSSEVTTSAATIYVYSSDGINNSDKGNIATGAGKTVSLATPTISATGFANATGISVTNPTFNFAVDNSQVLGSPEATLTYTFTPEGGSESSAIGGSSYTPSEYGTLKVIASADGYDSSEKTLSVSCLYTIYYAGRDYSTATTADAFAEFGEAASVTWDGWASGLTSNLLTNTVSDDQHMNIQNSNTINLVNGWGLVRYDKSYSYRVRYAKEGDFIAIKYNTSKGNDASANSYSTTYCETGTGAQGNLVTIYIDAAGAVQQIYHYSASRTSVSKTVTAAGYATYCSPYPLNFEGTGLTAYIAQKNGETIKFTPVNQVPANTGVLLKGDEGSYNIPVIASAATVDNVLVGVTVDTSIEADNFVLMNGTKGVGFYKTKNAFTVGANTAYLPASVAEGRTFIGFDDDAQTTGIQAVNSEKITMNGAIYNLNGQRVEKATKGLYIVNGKKTVKN